MVSSLIRSGMIRFGGAALLACILAFGPLAGPAVSGDATTASALGFAPERLQALSERIQGAVDSGDLPGAVILVSRHGEIAWFDAIGDRDAATGDAMARDAIFRIYSMTKPIVSVAVMMLHERGELLISDPIGTYLPELANLAVGVETIDPNTGATAFALEPAARPVTIQDLLRHTSGITYGVFGDSEVKRRYREADSLSWEQTSAEFITKMSALPLVFQPGSQWEYGQSTDVLGRLVEVVSGQPLDAFLAANILAPLGMADTGYRVPPGALGRVAAPHEDRTPLHQVEKRPTWLPGGHGLVATARDYWRFAEMMRNGGSLDGTRLLSPETVAYMTSDHLHPGISRAGAYLPGHGVGFGLGFAVRTAPGMADWTGTVGSYYWSGYGGTTFWVDPENALSVVFMSQSVEKRNIYRRIIRNMVYAALID